MMLTKEKKKKEKKKKKRRQVKMTKPTKNLQTRLSKYIQYNKIGTYVT